MNSLYHTDEPRRRNPVGPLLANTSLPVLLESEYGIASPAQQQGFKELYSPAAGEPNIEYSAWPLFLAADYDEPKADEI
jgi:hypothetical protein